MKKTRFNQAIQIACILSTALGISLIIGNGPSLQFYISRLITSTETSIYASSYGQSMSGMVDIQEWITQTAISPLLFCAPLIAAALLYFRNSRDALISTALATALSLTTIDIFYSAIYPRNDAPSLIENLVFNCLGSLIISPITILLLKTALLLSSNTKYKRTSLILGISTPPTLAILTTSLIYLLTSLLYKPVEARIDITLKEPMNFTYTPSLPTSEESEKGTKFGVLDGRKNVTGELTIIAPKGALQTTVKAAPDSSSRATVTFTSGCLAEGLEKLDRTNKTIELGKFKILKITNDSGPLDAVIRDINGKIKFTAKELNNTDIELSSEDKYTISRFSGYNDKLEYTSGLPHQSIFFGTPLINRNKEKELQTTTRRIKIEVDNKTYQIFLSAKDKITQDERKCSAVNATTLNKYYYQKLDKLDLIGGVLIDIHTSSENNFFSQKKNSITIKNIDGWARIANISKDSFGELFTSGNIKDLVIHQGIDTLIINGKTQDTKSTITLFTTNSSFYAYPIDNKSLRIYGTTKVAFKDQERVNRTRWESMDDVSRGAILSIIGLLALKLLSTAYSWIRYNANLYEPLEQDDSSSEKPIHH